MKNLTMVTWVASKKRLYISNKANRDLTNPNPTKKYIGSHETQSLIGALADAAEKNCHSIVTIILYDRPNHDCVVKASRGQLFCVYFPNGCCDFVRVYNCNKELPLHFSLIDIVIAANNMRK